MISFHVGDPHWKKYVCIGFTDVAETRFLSVINPCVRCPPAGRSRPMMRSCGLRRPVYTAKFAGDPL